MSIIPDYARQALEIKQQLEVQAEVTANYWSDNKRKEFYDGHIEPYLDWLDQYVFGGDKMQGKGLNDLLEFVSSKIDEFESEAGSSIASGIVAPGFSCQGYTNGCLANSDGQILAPTDMPSNVLNSDVPQEQTPEEVSERRADFVADYNLNSPGAFSAKNLREILNKRRNG